MEEERLRNILIDCLDSILSKICTELEFRELKRLYPKQIKGNIKASELLGITPNALCQRISKGQYRENFHFKKLSDRIYLWDRDILLNERFKR